MRSTSTALNGGEFNAMLKFRIEIRIMLFQVEIFNVKSKLWIQNFGYQKRSLVVSSAKFSKPSEHDISDLWASQRLSFIQG